ARRAIEGITYHRMSKRRHMDANLVRAPGLDFEFDQCKLAVRRVDFSLHGVMRDRFAAAEAPRRHARAPLRVAADGALNRAAVLLRPAVHQRDVSLVDLASAELLRQPAVRFI